MLFLLLVTDRFGAQQLNLDGFETYFLQVSFKSLLAALPIALLLIYEMRRKQQSTHWRKSVLNLRNR